MTKLQNNKHGLTLVELVVVLAIAGIIGAIAVATSFGPMESVQARACKSSRESIYNYYILAERVGSAKQFSNAMDYTDAALAGDRYVEKCPCGGTYSWDNAENPTNVVCSYDAQKEGKSNSWLDNYAKEKDDIFTLKVGESYTINGVTFTRISNTQVTTSTGETLDYTNYYNNTAMLKLLYAAYGYKWPTIEQGGKTFSLVPYTTIQGKELTTFIYATSNTTSASNPQGSWSGTYVYYPATQQWYKAVSGTNQSIICTTGTKQDVEDMFNDTSKWEKVDLDVTPTL